MKKLILITLILFSLLNIHGAVVYDYNVNVYTNSQYFEGEMNIEDSVYIRSLMPVTRYAGVYIDSLTGSMKIDSVVLGASWGLIDKLIPIDEFLNDTKNGEIAWIYYLPDGTQVVEYNLEGTYNTRFAKLFAAQEHGFRYIQDLEHRVKKLESMQTIKYNINLEKKINILEDNLHDIIIIALVSILLLLVIIIVMATRKI